MASRDRWDYLYVWERTTHKFYGLAIPSSNSPTWWDLINLVSLMLLDVLLGEVHEKIEGVCSTKGKTRELYGIGVHSIWVFLLFQWVHQTNWWHTMDSGLGWPSIWEQKGREDTPNEWKIRLIRSKSLIFCQFSTNKLFTLKFIIYIWYHDSRFEFLYTSMNLEIDVNKFIL